MKKLLNISVIAALAILPMAANATDYAVTDPTHADPATAAQTDPGWALAQSGQNDGNLATAGYVKGAYNQTMKAINKLESTKQNALSPDQLTAISNVSSLSNRMDAAENDIDALETTVGDANSGLVKDVDDLQTTVGDSNSGLVKAVADNTTDISALETTVGDSTSGLVKDVDDLQTTVGDSTSGLVKDVDDLQTTVGDSTSGLVKDVDDLQTTVGDSNSGLVKDVADLQTASADYAKRIGVTHTISNSTIAGTVPTVTVWGADTPGTAPITASITGATYTETAPTPAGN